MDSAEISRVVIEVLAGAGEQRARSNKISRGMMVQGDGNLDQALEEFLFRALRFAPDVFPHFVSVVEMALVEEMDAAMKSVGVHGQILAGTGSRASLDGQPGAAVPTWLSLHGDYQEEPGIWATVWTALNGIALMIL